jgi:methionine sulfoxide reductase catalytic subunit
MHIARRHGWGIPEHKVTPEAAVLGRRGLVAGAMALAVGPALAASPPAAAPGAVGSVNDRYKPGRALTAEKVAETYNNYYEIDDDKDIWQGAQQIQTAPWSIQVGGMVSKPRTIALEDLFRQVQFEERIYRHRCVEAWAMTVPWTGFPLRQLVKICDPLASAKYMVFQTAEQPKNMPGLDSPIYPWPYIEGLAIDEAANDLAFVSTGLFGKPLPKQNGGPVRLTVPWKYGFKSAKALAKISFTDKQPVNFWQAIAPTEYGFWANVNPAVPHPRWSQAQERLIGTGEMVPTVIYNGYGDFVASLYANRSKDKLFM